MCIPSAHMLIPSPSPSPSPSPPLPLPCRVKNEPQRNDLKAQLSCIQANITTLHAQLQVINNTTVSDLYRDTSNVDVDQPFPLIAVATKETPEVALGDRVNKFIVDHYHEDTAKFESECNDLQSARELMRNASVSQEGKDWCMAYYWKLHQSEHRAFQDDKCGELVFTWHDAFEGHPVAKKSLKLEKASVLYNVAAIDTQLAAIADRNTVEGLTAAVDSLEAAAGLFQFIREESSIKNTVGTDLARSSLSTLSTLMLAQAQECLWHQVLLKGKAEHGSAFSPAGPEAAAVAEWYQSVQQSLRDPLLSSLPAEWVTMISVKEQYYQGVADWFIGISEMKSADKKMKINGAAKVYRASLAFTDCLDRCSNELPTEAEFHASIRGYLKLTEQIINHIAKEVISGISAKLDQMPLITGKAIRWATTSCGQLVQHDRADLFARLGPVYFFNSMCALVERRVHEIVYNSNDQGFGFTLSGGNPCRVADVVYNGPGNLAGLLAGVYIVQVAGVDARCMVTSDLEEMLQLHAKENATITIEVVVNYDMQNFEELINPEVPKCMPSVTNVSGSMPMQWGVPIAAGLGPASVSLTGRHSIGGLEPEC